MGKLKTVVLLMPLMLFLGCESTGTKQEVGKKEDNLKNTVEKASNKQSNKQKTSTARCKIDNDERLISIEKSGAGCVVNYTKFGEKKGIAHGREGTSHCLSIKERIIKKLNAAGFSCDK